MRRTYLLITSGADLLFKLNSESFEYILKKNQEIKYKIKSKATKIQPARLSYKTY